MYINKFNLETDIQKIIPFIQENNFGTLITAPQGTPQATHLPFSLESNDNTWYLTAHMAKANAQWKQLMPDKEVLIIFGGPAAYISPRWYDHVNVPTMNYIAVHVYGIPQLINDEEEIYQMLKKQIEQYEGEHINEYNITSMPPKFFRNEVKALIAVKIPLGRIEANFKLSQNRDEKNYKNIIEELQKRSDTGADKIAQYMKEVYDDKGFRQTVQE